MFEDEEELPSIVDIDNYFSQSENYRNEFLETKQSTTLSPKQFYCSGEVMINDRSLNENSFLRMNELEYLNKLFTFNPILKLFDESVDCKIFDRTYICGSQILNDLDRLFNISSQNLKIILAASIAQSSKIGSSSLEYANYYLKRKQIIDFVYLLRHFLCRSWQLDSNYQTMKNTINIGMQKLLSNNITSLPEYVINHAGSKLGNESKNPAYHLFHLYLELKWLFLTIKYDLHNFAETRQDNIILTNDSEVNLTFNVNDKKDFERELKIIISDLIQIAVNIFNKTDPLQLSSTKPFNCVCVKELWIMIQIFTEQINSTGKCRTFWDIFNDILEQMPTTVNITHTNCLEIQLPFLFNCKNSHVFAIWITCHVAQLQGYTPKGIFIGRDNNLRISSNYSPIITNLSAWLNSDELTINEPQQTEMYLRALMPLLSQTMITWWDPKSEPIATLWEYFHRRLNSLFYLSTDPPQTMATICNTSSALLSQIKLRLQQDKIKLGQSDNETSYQQFLRLLGLFLNYCFKNNQQNQYQKLKGRIFPKFSLNKLVALNQTGLYNFVSLFLTMGVSADLYETGTKLQSLLSLLPPLEPTNNKMPILLSTNLALVQLFVENKLNIAEIANPLLTLLSQIENESNSFNINLRQIIIDGLQHIFEMSENFNSGEYILIDSWISRWLSFNNSSTNFSPIYDILISITSKLNILSENTNTIYGTENDYGKMSQNIFQHVLPALKQNAKATNINLQLADLISSVMQLSLNNQPLANKNLANFFTLFVYFVTSPDISLRLIEKILSKLLKSPKVLTELDKSFTNYQYTIVQLWLQCNLICIENNCENLADILRVLIDLPDIRTNFNEFSTLLECSDHITKFFEIISQKYDLAENTDDRNKIRNFLNEILNGIDNRITFILRSPSPDEKVILHTYTIVAKLFYHCSHLIYTKNTPLCFFHILVTLMLLPPALFTGRKLHPFCVGAIRQNWILYVQGTARNDYNKDPYMQKTLKDLIVQYVPYFTNKPGELSRRQPFLKIFDTNFERNLTKFILENIVINCLHFSSGGGKTPKPNALNALLVLKEILNHIRTDKVNVILFANCCFDGILEQIMFLESTEPSKKIAVELFNTIIQILSPFFKQPDVKESFLKCVRTLTKKHLGFNSMQVMRLLTYLAQECWIVIDAYMPELLQEVNNVENIRCVRYDTGLRNMVAKVANTVESSRHK